jgi:hypothetical protein
MLVYRVFPYLASAREREPGHPLYLHPGTAQGRLDNPQHYQVWYLALEASGAVGEALGNLREWGEDVFAYPGLPGSRRSLATYTLPDETPLLDLNNSRTLLERGLQPRQVVERNRAATQEWALRIFQERNGAGDPAWAGVIWWSVHAPHWRIVGYWGQTTPELLKVEELDLNHPAVIDAATTMNRLALS